MFWAGLMRAVRSLPVGCHTQTASSSTTPHPLPRPQNTATRSTRRSPARCRPTSTARPVSAPLLGCYQPHAAGRSGANMGAGHLVERGGSLIHTPPRSCSYVEALLLTSPPPPQHINNHRRRPPARPRGRLHEHGLPLHRRHVVLRLHGQLLRAGRLEQRRSDRHRQVPDVVVPRQQPRRPGADVPP